MKFLKRSAIFLTVMASCVPLLTARTYIVEKGDTWELIARKWGVHTDALKAENPAMPEVFMGLEINLPANSTEKPVSNQAIAGFEYNDRQIEAAEKALAKKDYSTARQIFSSAIMRRGTTTSRLSYLYAKSCEGSSKYIEALENYGQAARLFNEGDYTMTPDQFMAVNDDMARVLPLAQQQAEEEERRRFETQQRLEAERRARARAEQEKKRRRAERWGNIAQGLLAGLAQGMQAASGGWGYGTMGYGTSMPGMMGTASNLPGFAPNATLASAGITIPASLDISRWNPAMFQTQITYDASGNPMFSNPGAAAWMRQMTNEVSNYAAATGMNLGGAQGNYLVNLANSNINWGESQARIMETPMYAPTQEDIDNFREISEQASKDLRESLTSAKDNLEKIKNYNQLKNGGSSTSTGTTTASSTTSSSRKSSNGNGYSGKTAGNYNNSDKGNSSKSTSPTSSSDNPATSGKSEDKKNNSHEQYKDGYLNTTADSFTYKKHVKLMRRDGSSYRTAFPDVELYKKDSTYFIKIGDSFYRAEGTYTKSGYNMRIVYGGNGFFFRL